MKKLSKKYIALIPVLFLSVLLSNSIMAKNNTDTNIIKHEPGKKAFMAKQNRGLFGWSNSCKDKPGVCVVNLS